MNICMLEAFLGVSTWVEGAELRYMSTGDASDEVNASIFQALARGKAHFGSSMKRSMDRIRSPPGVQRVARGKGGD